MFSTPEVDEYVPQIARSIQFSDDFKHRIRLKQKETTAISQLTINKLNKEDHYVSYTCFGNNTEGSAFDAVDIHVTGIDIYYKYI